MKLWNEIKKIPKWWMLIGLTILFALYYFVNLQFSRFVQNPFSHQIAVDMVMKYGITLEEDEKIDFENGLQLYIDQADKYIKSEPYFHDNGIENWSQYEVYSHSDYLRTINGDLSVDPIYDEMSRLLYRENEIGMWIQSYNQFINGYIYKDYESVKMHCNNYATEKLIARCFDQELTEPRSIINWYLIYGLEDYVPHVLNLILLLCFGLIVCFVPLDRHQKIQQLQFTSKTGRKIINLQFKSILFICGGLALSLFFAYFAWMATKYKFSLFYPSVLRGYIIDITFGQYCLFWIIIGIMIIFTSIRLAWFISNLRLSMQAEFIAIVLLWIASTKAIGYLFQRGFLMSMWNSLITLDEVIGLLIWVLSVVLVLVQSSMMKKADL